MLQCGVESKNTSLKKIALLKKWYSWSNLSSLICTHRKYTYSLLVLSPPHMIFSMSFSHAQLCSTIIKHFFSYQLWLYRWNILQMPLKDTIRKLNLKQQTTKIVRCEIAFDDICSRLCQPAVAKIRSSWKYRLNILGLP